MINEPLLAYNLTVEGFHTYFVAADENAAPIWVHNDCFPDVTFSGLNQNRFLGELTDADFRNAFKNSDYILGGHSLKRLRDPRLQEFGFNSLNDLKRIIDNGVIRSADDGAVAKILDGVAIIINPDTKKIITITPWHGSL